MTLQHALEYLQEVYPDYDFRSGYIGNVGCCGGKYIDDRSFRIWCSDVYVSDGWGGTQEWCLKLGGQEDMDTRSERQWTLLLMYAVKSIEQAAEREYNEKV